VVDVIYVKGLSFYVFVEFNVGVWLKVKFLSWVVKGRFFC